MTREELKKHCQKQIEGCEMWARHSGVEPHGKIYEEHKLILELLEQEPKPGHWRHYEGMLICSECGTEFYEDIMEYCGDDVPKCCPHCGCRMVEPQESNDKCKNCEYYFNPDYTRCHECKAESEGEK